MPPTIQLNFQYTEADFLEFLRNYFIRHRLPVWGAVALGVLVLSLVFRSGPVTWSSVLPFLALVLTWLWLQQSLGKRNFRAVPEMQEPRACAIDAEKITVTGQSFSSEFPWTEVLRLVETKGLFLVYNSNTNAVMLPKRAFSEPQLSDFRALVSHLPGLEVKWRR